MKGPFGILLIGGGLILLYGLFTGKINLGNASLGSVSSSSVASIAGSIGVLPALPGTKCPAGQSNVAGACRPDPHKCGDGKAWFQGKCVDIVT